MELTKKESYAIQIDGYIKSSQLQQACSLSEEMIKKFPQEPVAYFMAAKAYYATKDYEEAQKKARIAFNLSHTKSDLRASAVLLASSLLMLERYEEAYKTVLPFEKEKDEEVKKLLLILATIRGKGDDAARYYKELYELNAEAAEKLIRSML